MSKPFPKKSTVWSGAILGGIVNAVMTARNSRLAAFQGWARNTYVLNGADGREGAITFAGGHWYPDAPLVGAFFDVHGRRSKNRAELLEHCFEGCPPYQRTLAGGGALLYLRYDGPDDIRATAAFWDDGDRIVASDPWEMQLTNGVDLIDSELVEDHDAALAAFQADCGLVDEQVTVIRRIFLRKLAWPADYFALSCEDVDWLKSTFEDPKAGYEELAELGPSEPENSPPAPKWWESIDTVAEAEKAIQKSREKFAALGIYFPE